MNLHEEFLKEHSRNHALQIASFIGNDSEKFAELMKLFLNSSYRLNQRSSMTVSLCVERNPKLFNPFIEPVLLNLKGKVPDAVVRNTLRILQFVDIPEENAGLAADICFSFLESSKTPVAIKVFSMTVLFNIAKKEPDLKNELKMLVEDQLPYASAGFKNRGKKILKSIAAERNSSNQRIKT